MAAGADGSGQTRLVAYLVTGEADQDAPLEALDLGALDLSGLRASLGARLPEHMVPQAFVRLARLPLTASGKLDRKALPDVEVETARRDYEAPESALEIQVAEAVGDLLELGDPVGRSDSFFALGGHSLLAVRLAARLEAETGLTLPVRRIFETPTISDLAIALESASSEAARGPGPVPVPRDTPLPLSYAQERLWFVEQFAAPGSIAEVLGFDFEGEIDPDEIKAIFGRLYARHEGLRLRVDVHEGLPVQVFADTDALPWTYHDMIGADEAALEALFMSLRARPVDPAEAAFRVDLVQTGEMRATLVMSLHHMVYDGVSMAVLLAEFGALMQMGVAQVLPPLELQYGDFSVWQREALNGGQLVEGLERFAQVLGDPPAPLALPSDRPRPQVPTHAAAQVALELGPDLVADLKSLAQGEGASLFMVLESALAVLLSREARVEDLVIGTVAAGRAHMALEGAVGPFFNMVALRHRIDGNASFKAALAETREQALGAFDDQLVPFEAVLERVITQRDARLAVSPLFQVLFQLHTEAASLLAPFEAAGVKAQARDWGKVQAMQDLTFDLFEEAGGVTGRVTYSTELFDHARIEALLERYRLMLGALVADPEMPVAALTCLPASERCVLLEDFAGDLLGDYGLLPGRIAGHVGDAVWAGGGAAGSEAVDGWLSYSDLDGAASRFARWLGGLGVGRGDVVGVAPGGDGAQLVTALLGLWKLGAVWLPLDARYPRERLSFMLEDAGAQRVLAAGPGAQALGDKLDLPFDLLDGAEVEAALEACDDSPLEAAAGPGDLAYIIYTSGSTGRPKGVGVEHKALAAFVEAIVSDLGGQSDRTVLSGAAPIFDAIFMDLAVSLGAGGRLVRLSVEDLATPGRVSEIAAAHGADYMDLTPSVWRAVLGAGFVPGPDMQVVTGGEALDAELSAKLSAQGAALYNSYGPTEASVVAIAGGITSDDLAGSVPIGSALPGVCGYVLDGRLEPVPVGVAGELVLGGAQVARGYLGRSGLTARQFIADPFSATPGARAYRTGDLVRWRADGRLEFLGRIDAQIKIRGQRVELGEIETALAALPDVQVAAVTVAQDRLVAYLVPAGSEQNERVEIIPLEQFDLAKLRNELAQSLPEHMIPQAFAGLSALPLTASGKLNRKALPDVEVETAQTVYEDPIGDMETSVAAIFSELLEADRVGRNDGFFALGGHSLLAVRLVARLEEMSGAALPISAIFEGPAVAQIAEALERVNAGDAEHDIGVSEAIEDLSLADALPNRHGDSAVRLSEAQRILLTGATGFFGRYLMRDLLWRTSAQLRCVVRGVDERLAIKRVQDALRAIPDVKLPTGWERRIEVVLGDLGKPQLGLEPSIWEDMSDSVDAILHNAAEVNVVKPYSMLKAGNTMSVLHMLELMSKGRAKSLTFVSTLGTTDQPFPKDRIIRDPALDPAPEDSGYNLSKWAAEQLILRARAKGYDAKIMRPGLIIGDSLQGYYDTSDVGYSYLSLFTDTGAVPDALSYLPMPWINVDRGAKRLLDLAEVEELPFGTAHIFDYGAAPTELMREAGSELAVIPGVVWARRAVAILENDPEHVALWLLPRLQDIVAEADQFPKELLAPVDVKELLAGLAPPDLPFETSQADEIDPAEGLAQPMKWVAAHRRKLTETDKT